MQSIDSGARCVRTWRPLRQTRGGEKRRCASSEKLLGACASSSGGSASVWSKRIFQRDAGNCTRGRVRSPEKGRRSQFKRSSRRRSAARHGSLGQAPRGGVHTNKSNAEDAIHCCSGGVPAAGEESSTMGISSLQSGIPGPVRRLAEASRATGLFQRDAGKLHAGTRALPRTINIATIRGFFSSRAIGRA